MTSCKDALEADPSTVLTDLWMRPTKLYSRRYNAPEFNEIIIITRGEQSGWHREIILHRRESNKKDKLIHTYDALQYILLFVNGRLDNIYASPRLVQKLVKARLSMQWIYMLTISWFIWMHSIIYRNINNCSTTMQLTSMPKLNQRD